MSLYLGHLSSHVRREELERVFWRFGQCNIRLKDGYGFVIYEDTANAENALRVLRGKTICGELISLNWSNRQPRPFQRSARNNRFYEPYRGRNFNEEDNGVGIRGSRDQRNFAVSTRVPSHNRGNHHLDNVPDKGAGPIYQDVDDMGRGKAVSLKEGARNEGGTVELNQIENDRWGEPASDTLAVRGPENSSEFDHYEPYRGYNRRDEKENNHIDSSYSCQDHGISPEKGRRGHSFDEIERGVDKSKPQRGCYNFGLVGHILRNCPPGNSKQEKFSRFNHMKYEVNFRDMGEGGVKRLKTNSLGKPNSSRDPLMSRHRMQDRKESHSGKARMVGRSGSFLESREKSRPKPRAESQIKNKRKLKHGTPKKVLKKRTRRSGTSSISADPSTTSSQSHSKSSTSDTSSHSRSRSPSSRSCPRSPSPRSGSASSSSRSASTSSYLRSLSSRSRLKSRSRSSSLRSLSLSVLLDQKSPSSPKHDHMDVHTTTSPKGNLEHVPSPEYKHPLSANLENSERMSSTLKSKNALTPFKVDGETNGQHPGSDGDNAPYSAYMVGDKENNSCADMYKDIDVTSVGREEKNKLEGDMYVKLDMQVPVRCEESYSTRMSTQEMLLALRHYGLETPEGDESDISVEGYFGAARLWPWEIIYYRRLKRGPISTENYARRLEQNREFGIVDKYIRSSSGWAECNQNDT